MLPEFAIPCIVCTCTLCVVPLIPCDCIAGGQVLMIIFHLSNATSHGMMCFPTALEPLKVSELPPCLEFHTMWRRCARVAATHAAIVAKLLVQQLS